MRTLYLDCGMGAAGDMLTAALLELLPDTAAFIDRLNSLDIPGVSFSAAPSVKCGITGTHVSVTVDGTEEESIDAEHDHEHSHGNGHHHHHSDLHGIEHIVRDHLSLSERIQKDVLAVYGLIAEAESHVHGVPVDQIHFHEVGEKDAIADITAVCMLMEELAPDQVIVSPVHVGSGKVRCAHGILPVPAPATAYILRDVPVYGGSIKGELCTPTGAALLKHFATRFGDMPVMRIGAVGYGMGNKDFEAANCVRAILGETDEKPDGMFELSCNLDDMTGEKIAFAVDRIYEAGAVDVYTIPIGMKKSRPGILVRAMCSASKKEAVISAIFRHTTTLGIRETRIERYYLDRHIVEEDTEFGVMRRKEASGYGVQRSKWEYEDLASAALKTGISIAEIEERLSGSDK